MQIQSCAARPRYVHDSAIRQTSTGKSLSSPAQSSLAPALLSTGLAGSAASSNAASAPSSAASWIKPIFSLLSGVLSSASNSGLTQRATPLNLSGAGAAIGTLISPGFGTVIGGVLGAAAGAVLSRVFGGGSKEPGHAQRDVLRSVLTAAPFPLLDAAGNLQLADGTLFNIAADSATAASGGGTRHLYDIDWTVPDVDSLVSALDPLASFYSRLACGSSADRTANMVGWLLNAALTSGDAGENILNFYAQSGLDADTLSTSILTDFAEGKISEESKNVRLASVEQIFSTLTDELASAFV